MIIDKLMDRIIELKNPLCVELNTTLDDIPPEMMITGIQERWKTPSAAKYLLSKYNAEVIDVIKDLVSIVSVPIAPYIQYGSMGLDAFRYTISTAKINDLMIIADVRVGDRQEFSRLYVESYLDELTIDDIVHPGHDVDFLTVNPYCGMDSIGGFMDACKKFDKGLFVIAKTFNELGFNLQEMRVITPEQPTAGTPIYQEVLKYIQSSSEHLSAGKYNIRPIGAIVEVDHPHQLGLLRKWFRSMLFLTSFQRRVEDTIAAFRDEDKLGGLVRHPFIVKAHKDSTYQGMDWKSSIRQAVLDAQKTLRLCLSL